MVIFIGIYVSPLALAALAFGAMLGLRAAWWQVLAAVIVAAACGLLAVIGAFTLARRVERRDGRRWQQGHAREVPVSASATAIPQASHPAIAPAPQVTVNFYGVQPSEAAAIIRQALPPGRGGAITEGRTADDKDT